MPTNLQKKSVELELLIGMIFSGDPPRNSLRTKKVVIGEGTENTFRIHGEIPEGIPRGVF